MMTKLGALAVCSLLICCAGPIRVAGAEETNGVSCTEILAHIQSNEATVASVVIEGRYEATQYGSDGIAFNIRKYSRYRFSRRDRLVKTEVQGEETFKDERSHDWASVPVNEVIFFSPQSTVYVDMNQMIAHRRPAEQPFPFALYWGFGIRCFNSLGDIRPLSIALQKCLKDGVLTCRRDPAEPDLLVLEVTRGRVTFRDWVDPQHGYLIVKYDVHQSIRWPFVLPEPYDREFLCEEWEIVPKRFGAHWFYASARMKRFDLIFPDHPSVHLRVSHSEETLTVSDFLCGVSFEPGDLEFSTNQFPRLKAVDRKIGTRAAWPAEQGSTDGGAK